MPVTGDLTTAVSYNTQASAFPFTKVPVAGHHLNQTHLSCKKDGAGFVGDDYNLYIATGSAPTDTWVVAGAADETGDITPA